MTTPLHAAVYLRVSLDSTGEGLAVDRQREDCRKIAADRGWTVIREYVDNSISASSAKKVRPAYNRMVEDFAAGGFEALICWDLDRLTRQPRQLEDWIDAAQQRGLRLVTANGEADLATDNGRMFARIKATVARGEIERKGARQTRALRQRAESGRPPLGVRLTGYTTQGDVLPDEAAMVRECFTRFSAGESLRGIAGWLNQQPYPTRRSRSMVLRAEREKRDLTLTEERVIDGSRWSPSTVRTMLTNPRYAGHVVYRGARLTSGSTWQPLVSPEEFALVQHRISDPRRVTNRQGTDRKHFGSGLYRCSCGLRMRGWSGNRYRCADGCYSRSGAEVDPRVQDLIAERLSRPDLADLLAATGDGDHAERLLLDVRRLSERLSIIESDYDAGLIDGQRYAVAADKVRTEMQSVELERARILAGTGPASVLTATDPAAAFRSASLMIRRATVAFFVDITLKQTPRGSRTFDPSTIVLDWIV